MELVRKWIQIITAFLVNGSWSFPYSRTIYQGPLKVLCSPGLNCYSCPAATTYCPLGALQQLLGGVRLSLAGGQYFFGFSVLGSMGVLGGFFGRMICGWVCPFGLVQELLYKVKSPKFAVPRVLRYGKYLFLLLFVILLPLLAVDEFGGGAPWFCKYICPAGTLEAGIPLLLLQPDLRSTLGLLFWNKLVLLLGFTIWSVVASRPFCIAICPLGAFYALFSRVKLVRLRLDQGRCTNCGSCHTVCPMGVKFNESPDDCECITCLKCMKQGCKLDAIYLEVGGIPVSGRPQARPGKRTGKGEDLLEAPVS